MTRVLSTSNRRVPSDIFELDRKCVFQVKMSLQLLIQRTFLYLFAVVLCPIWYTFVTYSLLLLLFGHCLLIILISVWIFIRIKWQLIIYYNCWCCKDYSALLWFDWKVFSRVYIFWVGGQYTHTHTQIHLQVHVCMLYFIKQFASVAVGTYVK